MLEASVDERLRQDIMLGLQPCLQFSHVNGITLSLNLVELASVFVEKQSNELIPIGIGLTFCFFRVVRQELDDTGHGAFQVPQHLYHRRVLVGDEHFIVDTTRLKIIFRKEGLHRLLASQNQRDFAPYVAIRDDTAVDGVRNQPPLVQMPDTADLRFCKRPRLRHDISARHPKQRGNFRRENSGKIQQLPERGKSYRVDLKAESTVGRMLADEAAEVLRKRVCLYRPVIKRRIVEELIREPAQPRALQQARKQGAATSSRKEYHVRNRNAVAVPVERVHTLIWRAPGEMLKTRDHGVRGRFRVRFHSTASASLEAPK